MPEVWGSAMLPDMLREERIEVIRDEFEDSHMDEEEYGESVRDIIYEAVSERDGE